MASSTLPRKHGAMRENIVEALREEIVSGRLEPGEPLRTEAVMERFGVSNSPLREAFAQLAVEGLVEVSRNRGARVAPLDRAIGADLVRVVDLLWEHVMRWGLPRLTPGDVSMLRRISAEFDASYGRGDHQQAAADASRFQNHLLDTCGSPELARTIRSGVPRLLRLTRLLEPMDHLAGFATLQNAIIAAAEAGEVEVAVAASHAGWQRLARAVESLPDVVLT